MKKTAIRIICFMVVLLTVLNSVNRVLKVKYSDGIYGLTKFYELEDNSVDVLILGSSHAFEDFNTGILWDDYGMASYILAGSMQPMWNTYYYLKEALKTQKPELIVLEGYMTTYTQEYTDDSRIIKNNYGLKWSKDKIDSIKVSVPRERWIEFLPEYVQYHTRYTEISGEDFLPGQGRALYNDWKGFGCNMNTEAMENPDVSNIKAETALFKKTEMYYRKIIELAQGNDIPITIIISPYGQISEEEQKLYNTAEDIAAEYGVDFKNYNLCYQEAGIDFATDAGDGAHLNYKGNQKFSKAVGRYLTEKYNISDRRDNLAYQSWKRNADYIREQILNQKLVETSDMESFLSQIENEHYCYFISIDGNCNSGIAELVPIMDAFQISKDKHRGIWYVNMDDEVWYSGGENAERYIQLDRHDVCMKRILNADSSDYSNTVLIDNVEYKKVTNGINVTIYNEVTQTIADCVGFDADEGFNLVR